MVRVHGSSVQSRVNFHLSDMPIGRVMRMGMAHGDLIPADVIAAYEAPFPDDRYLAGARKFRVDFIERSDLISLSEECARITDIPFVMDAFKDEAEAIIDGKA